MSTDTAVIAGVHLLEQRPTHDVNIEYWLANCEDRLSEVYFVPRQDKERLSALPNLVGFTQCQIVEVDDQIAVVMPGVIQLPVTNMVSKLGVSNCIGMAWHIADLLSLLHQSGRAHNLLHPESIGLNDLGELEIRPALGRFIASDPDPKASSIATDCWQMRQVVHYLGISEKVDPLFALLNRGIQEEFARLRLQPATAIRQSISAVLARHSEWETQFVDQMGKDWALNQRNLRESTIIPHRLQTARPTLSIDDVKDVSDSIDLWGNLFASSSVDGVSSSQALLLEALSAKTPTQPTSPVSRIQLPTHRGEPIEEDRSTLEVDLIGPTSIQIPMKPKRSGLVSIQEVGLGETPAVEEKDFYHGFSAIVEETAEDLEVLHRRRRSSQSRRSNQVAAVAQEQSRGYEETVSSEHTEQIATPKVYTTVPETVTIDEHDASEATGAAIPSIESSVDVRQESIEINVLEAAEAPSEQSLLEEVEAADTDISTPISPAVDVDVDDVDMGTPIPQEDVAEEYEESPEQQAPVLDEESETVHETSESLDIEIEERQAEALESNVDHPLSGNTEAAEPLEDTNVAETKSVEGEVDAVHGEAAHNEHHVETLQTEGELQVATSMAEQTVDSFVDEATVPHLDPETTSRAVDERVLPEHSEAQQSAVVSAESTSESSLSDASLVESPTTNVAEGTVVGEEPKLSSYEDTFSVRMPAETVEEISESELEGDGAKEDHDRPNDTIADVLQAPQELEQFDDGFEVVEFDDGVIGTSEEEHPPEVTGPVSILNMPLISIVEEDDFSGGTEEENEESEDDGGVSLAFLINDAPPEVTQTELEEVFQTANVPTPNTGMDVNMAQTLSTGEGFVAALTQENSTMQGSELDVEEPLADIDFPSIEEVRAQDKTFAGDVNSLFDSSEPVVSQSSTQIQRQLDTEPGTEPKWTGATSFDNLTNSEDALGDEKYAHAQVELGDVDAVLGESIRDFSELERKGSPWAFLLIASLVVIFGAVYVLASTSSEESTNTEVVTSTAPIEALPTHVEILTDPPRGKVLIDKSNLGVAPTKWEITEGDVFLMCVDWGSNPVCRRVPKADLQSETYTFTQKLTP